MTYEYKYLHAVGESSYWLDHRLVPEVRAMFAAMASRAPAGGIRARYQQILDAMMDTTGTSTWEAKGYICAGHREAWQFDCSACGEPYYATEGDEKPPTRCVSCFGPVPKDSWDAEDRLCRYPLHPKVQKFFNDFVGSYGHCYDDKTEVLAYDLEEDQISWFSWADALKKQKSLHLAAFNPQTDTVSFEEPSHWIEKPYQGKMYQLQKQRGNLDLLVTPEHTMLVRKREYVSGSGRKNLHYLWSDWRGLPAREVFNKTNLRYKRGAENFVDTRPFTEQTDPWGLAKINMRAFGQMCGFFVGDGYAGGKQAGYLSFNLRKDREQQFLAGIESALNLKIQRYKNGCSHIHLPNARDWARKYFYSAVGKTPQGKPAKDIPVWVMLAPETFIEGFFEGLHYSDGSTVSKDSWSFSNTSLLVMNKLQILGTLWGKPVSIRGPDHKQGYVAFISGHKCKEPVVNRGHHVQNDSWVDYQGTVYCATVSTGFLVVRRNFATMISGNSSIMELTGSPAVYTEGISWLTAWLLFDSPLCAGQEFSTRAVQHKDWPMARDADELHYIHDTWFAVFEAEVAWWKDHLASPENRAALGIGDKEPFRPALDRARWALPGTISTGCAHTSSLRERARVLRDGSLLAQASQSEKAVEVWAEIADTYRKALPGLSGMGLREAVYDATGNQLPGHLRALLTDVADGPDVFVDAITFPGIDSDTEDFIDETPRPGEKTYRDPIVNHQCRVGVQFRCSLAVARDWHRHRTLFPWTLQLVRDDNGHIQIDHHYEPKSDYAKKTVPGLLGLSTLLFNRLMEQGNVMTAALALPLGARVSLRGSGGLRDVTYMGELRCFAHGANFEYQDQAKSLLDQLSTLI